jgi:hypothetical protein
MIMAANLALKASQDFTDATLLPLHDAMLGEVGLIPHALVDPIKSSPLQQAG